MSLAISPYVKLMRLNRPIGIALLLWPTLIALWLASYGAPSIKLFVIFTLGVLMMRSAGCVINDYADKEYDGHVTRTADRPLVTGLVSSKAAIILFVALLLVSFILILFTNLKTMLLAPIGAILAALYPFTKRFIQLPQVILGIAFAWAIPMAYSASGASLSWSCWLLFLATVFWAVAYDTQYAMTDKEDDLKIGVKSSAILFGEYDTLMILTCHFLMLSFFVILGLITDRGAFFFLGVFIALCFALYQQWLTRAKDPKACFKAFLNNQWIGAVLFIGTVFDFYFV
ncbi:MAG: 4-hydroxybenzoate octaprenyltransferase [Candidatus Berkiella sp.]